MVAEQTLSRSSYAETITHCTKALDLLPALPQTSERAGRELALLITLRSALVPTKGDRAPEVAAIYRRAQVLCDQLEEGPQRVLALGGVVRLYWHIRTEVQPALEAAKQQYHLAQRLGNSTLLLRALCNLGPLLFTAGSFAAARDPLQQAMRLCDTQSFHTAQGIPGGLNYFVESRGYLAFALWHLGYPDQALEPVREGLVLAHEGEQPFSLALAFMFACALSGLRGDTRVALEHAESLLMLATEQDYPHWIAVAKILRGAARAKAGQVDGAIALMRQGIEAHRNLTVLGLAHYLSQLAEVYSQVGRLENGLAVISEAWTLVDRSGEQADVAELHRLQGELLRDRSFPDVAKAESCFLKAVSYEFLLRSAAVAGNGMKTGFRLGDEVKIACRFAARGGDVPEIVRCSGSGITVSGSLGETLGDRTRDGVQLFAGPRADAFFFNSEWATQASKEGILIEPENDNFMTDLNVLSIVLELEIARLGLGDAKLLAIAAQTMTQDKEGAPWRRLDWIGRPEITNVSMVAHDDDEELRDSYNQIESFSASERDLAPYRERLRRNIGFFDATDQVKDWSPQWIDVLADLLLQDYLVVDPSMPCGDSSYFEIESFLLRQLPHTRCGGRIPQDDIMDRIFTLMINGGHGRQVRDGVDVPSPDLDDGFPYLAEPNSGIMAWIKARFGQKTVRPRAGENDE